jgi:cytochrome c553
LLLSACDKASVVPRATPELSEITPELSEVTHPGKNHYVTNCAGCHGADRFGLLGPPLLSQTLGHHTEQTLKETIWGGISGTRMPEFRLALDEQRLALIVDYIQQPLQVEWQESDIRASLQKWEQQGTSQAICDTDDVTAVVERGSGNVLFIHDQKLAKQIYFPNVHGGLKFLGEKLYIPSRTGFILRCDVPSLQPELSVRAGVYMRNIEVTDSTVIAACSLPPRLAFFDLDLQLNEILTLDDEVAALARLDETRLVVTFRNAPKLIVLEGSTIVQTVELPAPFKQFAVVGDFVVGTNGTTIYATDFTNTTKIEDDAIPHMAAGQFWRHEDSILWATPKINGSGVTVYRFPDGDLQSPIEKVTTVEAEALTVRGHTNVFARAHPDLDFLVTTSGRDVLIVSKTDFRLMHKLTPQPDMMPLHTEFSKDGKILFVSVYDERGGIYMYSTDDFSLLRMISAVKPAGQYNKFMKSWQGNRRGL